VAVVSESGRPLSIKRSFDGPAEPLVQAPRAIWRNAFQNDIF
jgi:hypothetical protein